MAAAAPHAWKFTLWLAAGLFVLRALYLPWCELFPEEAYYWNYAQHLDIGYLDHPPMVAWLIALGTAVFGHGEWAVRVGALGCSALTAFFAFRLTRTLGYDRRAAWTAVGLVQLLPYFFAAGWIMTPDAPLTACWAATLYFLARVLLAGDGRAWWGVGAALGLGMLSKYTVALLGVATLVFLVLDPAARRWFRDWRPYAAVTLAVAIFSPVIVWNARHHWASFAFQSVGRVEAARRFSFHELLGAILVVLTPLGVVLAGRVLTGRAADDDGGVAAARRRRFARVYALVPLAVFAVFSLTHRVKLNWTGPLWLAVVPGIAAFLADVPARGWRTAWNATAAVLAVGYAGLLQYLAFGLPGVGYARRTELLPVGWRQMAAELDARRDALESAGAPGPVLVVGMDKDFIASETAFYNPDQTHAVEEVAGAHLFGGDSLMYSFWLPAPRAEGATLVLAGFERAEIDGLRVRQHGTRLEPVEEHPLKVRGKPARTYYTRVVSGYHSRRSGP